MMILMLLNDVSIWNALARTWDICHTRMVPCVKILDWLIILIEMGYF